jgi:hypothetical protein
MDPNTFSYNGDDGSNPVALWKQDPTVLDPISRVLSLPPAAPKRIDGYGTYYVWPYLVDSTFSQPSATEIQDLHSLGFDDAEIERMAKDGRYTGPRLSIDEAEPLVDMVLDIQADPSDAQTARPRRTGLVDLEHLERDPEAAGQHELALETRPERSAGVYRSNQRHPRRPSLDVAAPGPHLVLARRAAADDTDVHAGAVRDARAITRRGA